MKLIFSLLKSSFEGDSFRMISNFFNFLPNHWFTSYYVIQIEWAFYYFAVFCQMYKHHVNGTVQFIFFLVMRLNITIAMSCGSFVVILAA